MSLRLLHVDDDRQFLEMASTFLEREPSVATVVTGASASEGLDALERTRVDCVVSDYQMPGADGLEFLREVRQRHPELPFVLFTGQGSEEVASEAISAGVSDYLQKERGSDQFTLLVNRVENLVDRHRAERRLQESQRRFRTLVSNLPGMAYRCRNEPEWPMEFVSEGCRDLTGYDVDALLEGDVRFGRDVIHAEDRDRVWTAVQEALERREPFRVEYRILTAEGDERWVWEQGRGVFEDDAVVALEGFVTDVTDRKESERRLQYHSSLLEAQMEATIDGLLIVDEDRNVVAHNEQFVELWGIPDAVMEAGDDRALLEWVAEEHLADPEAFEETVDRLYGTPEETLRDRVELLDGRVFERYSAPVVGDDGTNFGRLWVFRDLTGAVRPSDGAG